jgi:hypothetical protein
MILAIAITGFVSVQMLYGTLAAMPHFGHAIFWILVFIWVAAAPMLLFRQLNVWLLRLAGAREPDGREWHYVGPLWHRVADHGRVRRDRYVLMLVDHEFLVHRDFGCHVVAVDRDLMMSGDDRVSAAVLAQRLARQTSLVAPLLGLWMWTAIPFVLLLAVSLLAYWIIRVIRKAAGAMLDELKPRTDAGAGCWLLILAVAIFAFIVALAVGLTIVFATTIMVAVVVVALWLVRLADAATDAIAARYGYGRGLLVAMSRFDGENPYASGWQRLFSTFASPTARVNEIRRVVSTEQ